MSENPTPSDAEVKNPDAAPEQPAAEPVKFDRSQMSAEDRMAILQGKGAEVYAAQQQKAAEAKPGEEPAEPKPEDSEPAKKQDEPKPESDPKPEDAKPEPKKDEEEEDDEPVKMPKLRITPKDAKQLQFFSLIKEGKSEQEAFKEVYGAPKPEPEKPKPEPKEEVKNPFEEIDASIETANSELEDLEQRLTDAQEAEDVKESSDLTRQIVKKELEIEGLKKDRDGIEQSQVDEQMNAFDTKVQESADKVYAKFPDLADEKSDARKEFLEYYAAKAKDPDYEAVFKSAKWPEIMAREFADEKGLTPAGAKPPESPTPPDEPKKEATPPKPAAEKKPEAPKPKASASKVLTSGDDSQAASIQKSRETYQKDRKNMTLEEKKALLGKVPVNV